MHQPKGNPGRWAPAESLSGGVLLNPTPGRMRNGDTGRIFPCCWSDCETPGNTRIDVQVPHPTPRWRDEATGKQEMLVYIFCSEAHKTMFLKGTPLENRG